MGRHRPNPLLGNVHLYKIKQQTSKKKKQKQDVSSRSNVKNSLTPTGVLT